jgi:nucleotide-binding universal stress UspA family protein
LFGAVHTQDAESRDKMKILIAIDDSAYSNAALQSVLSRPWPDDTHFRIITVVEPFHPEYAGWQTNYVPLAIEAQKTQVETAEKLIADAKSALQAKFSHCEVSGEVVEGYIKDKILQVANEWPASLIILGSHGRRGFTKFLLGSVSEAVAAHAECSVEIVKMPRTPE